jgi:erythromycin esterase
VEVINWLRKNAILIEHIEAGNGFDDLQPLKALLRDVKVVGLGETTHGTREFFQFKHRLLEFLVTEMNFSAFAIEASAVACQPINDFVVYGKGELATALTVQGYVPWDTEEFVEMLNWLRAYNLRVADEKKVHFHGVDLWRNDLGRQAVLDYLRKVAPERVTATAALFNTLASAEARWPTHIDTETAQTLGQLLPRVSYLIDYLIANQAVWVSHTTQAEFDRILQYTQVMKQWLIANTPDSLHPSLPQSCARSVLMAQNLVHLIDRDKPDAKYVVWAHNQHISLGNLWNGESNWGSCLRERYGPGYYALGFEFGQGSFYTRTALPNNDLGDLKAVALSSAPSGSWPWYLSQAGVGDLILNLRPPAGDPVVQQWLTTPRRVRNANWVYDEQSPYGGEVNLVQKYDGIIFIQRTTPTHPTANALKTVASRVWL